MSSPLLPQAYVGPGSASGWTPPTVTGATEDAQAAIENAIKAGTQIVSDGRSEYVTLLHPGGKQQVVPIKKPGMPLWLMIAGAGAVGIGAWLFLKGQGGGARNRIPMGSGIQLADCPCSDPEDRLDGIRKPKRRKPKSQPKQTCRKVKKGKASFTVCT